MEEILDGITAQFAVYRDWKRRKKKSRNRHCFRGLRLKMKKPAAVVDFAGLLKRVGWNSQDIPITFR